MIYEIIHKGKVLERLATKSVAENIAEMYRRGEVWTTKKKLSDVKVIERRLNYNKMEFKAVTPQLTDDLGNDLLSDVSISNLMQEATDKMVKGLQEKREAIIRAKLKEIIGIEINIEDEQKRRFKRLSIEYNGKEETIYFNDGSVNGKRIVTFIQKDIPFDFNSKEFKISSEYSYY